MTGVNEWEWKVPHRVPYIQNQNCLRWSAKNEQNADTTADFTTKRSCRNRNIMVDNTMVHGEIIQDNS